MITLEHPSIPLIACWKDLLTGVTNLAQLVSKILNSGRFNEDKIKQKMLDAGILSRDVPSTTNPIEITSWYNNSQNPKNGNKKIPLIIGATYQSASKLLNTQIPITLIIADEAHNLLVGKFPKEHKENFHKIGDQTTNKYFFTATYARDKKRKKGDVKIRRWGMQNKRLFGKIIHKVSVNNLIVMEILILLQDYLQDVVNIPFMQKKMGKSSSFPLMK
jgi:predicted helicase